MILLATPARDRVEASFAYDLVQLVQHTREVLFGVALGSLLPNLRTELVRQAINSGASHILFLDSDMRFPKDTLERLLKHDLEIVGANCKQRTKDEWTARRGEFISSEGKTGLEEVDTLGFGVTLIKLSVFSAEPWFATPFDGEKFVGEDVFFSTKMKEQGHKIFVDHDLSREVKHTGNKEYGYN